MESAVNKLEASMTKADEQMDNLAGQVVQLETELTTDNGAEVQVFNLLQSVQSVKENYSSLQRDVLEVRNQQKELSSTIQKQIALMQTKCNFLREKLASSPASIYPGRVLPSTLSFQSDTTDITGGFEEHLSLPAFYIRPGDVQAAKEDAMARRN